MLGRVDALLAMAKAADRVPTALGVKVKLMVQLELEGTPEHPLAVAAKSVGFSPVAVMPATVSGLLPVLLSNTL